MGYNLKKLRNELTEKGFCDEGLIGWGQNVGAAYGILGGAVGGAIGAAKTKMHAITKMGNAIAVFPFTNNEILYNDAIKIDASGIKKAKVSGLLTGKLVIRLNDNKKVTYSIMQGKSDVKKILKSLGL